MQHQVANLCISYLFVYLTGKLEYFNTKIGKYLVSFDDGSEDYIKESDRDCSIEFETGLKMIAIFNFYSSFRLFRLQISNFLSFYIFIRLFSPLSLALWTFPFKFSNILITTFWSFAWFLTLRISFPLQSIDQFFECIILTKVN